MPLPHIEMKGELPPADVFPDNALSGPVPYLRPTVAGGLLWTGGDEYKEHCVRLAEFFNSHVDAPYYVHQGFKKDKETLSFIFLERIDARRFVERFGQSHRYQIKDAVFEENVSTLQMRSRNIVWEPVDKRLNRYIPR